jgi:diadenosine tetraphosphatase ApaH/serine/threonine PP2A family protein phosphatase
MTRVLVISDVHANLTALEAVLADAGELDEVWCLGDVVGYGPDPNECISLLRTLPKLTWMMGNHDFAAAGDLGLEAFNSDARKSLLWQRDSLSPENLEFLRLRPTKPEICANVTLAHGSPRDPIWEYVLNTLVARINLGFYDTPWCFVGHSHFQVVFQYDEGEDDFSIQVPDSGSMYQLTQRAILNPGSVGQPRDRDPRAAYAIFLPETDVWNPHRVEYDFKSVQKRILASGLPPRHAERLAGGW